MSYSTKQIYSEYHIVRRKVDRNVREVDENKRKVDESAGVKLSTAADTVEDVTGTLIPSTTSGLSLAAP